MYATWKDYNVITNMGAKKEVLIIPVRRALWMSSPGYAPTRKNKASLYYGHDGTTIVDGGYINSGYDSQYGYGARPALYH